MVSAKDFETGKPITPKREAQRVAKYAVDRNLYQGKWTVQNSAGEVIARPRRINWFKAAARIYGELLISSETQIYISTGGEGAVLDQETTDQYFPNMPLLYSRLNQVVQIMVIHGTSILHVVPDDNNNIEVLYPDEYFPIMGTLGRQRGAVVSRRYRDRQIVYIYEDGKDTIMRVFQRRGENFGKMEDEYTFEGDRSRRVFPIARGLIDSFGFGESLFDAMAEPVESMGLMLDILETNISENSDPTLFGPEGAVGIDDDGNYVVQDGGLYIPVGEGQARPGFLTYDTESLAVQLSLRQNEEQIFVQSGLPRGLFDPGVVSGNSTGSALRRALIPLVGVLNQYGLACQIAINGIFGVLQAQEGDDMPASNLVVDWGFKALLGDITDPPTVASEITV